MEKKGRGGLSKLSVEIFFLIVHKHFVEEPFSAVFQKISVGEKVYGREWGGGVSKYSVENFLSESAEKFRSGIF